MSDETEDEKKTASKRTFTPPTKKKPPDEKKPDEKKQGKSLGQWWSEDAEDDWE